MNVVEIGWQSGTNIGNLVWINIYSEKFLLHFVIPEEYCKALSV